MTLPVMMGPCATCTHLGFSHDNWEVCAECGCELFRPMTTETNETHRPIPTAVKPESFSRCAVCGQMLTRITKQGKRGSWRHLEELKS